MDLSAGASLALYGDPDWTPISCGAVGWLNVVTIPAVPVGETVYVEVVTSGFDTPGTHNVRAFADYTCALDEYQDHESNNQYAINVPIGPPRLPDLTVLSVEPKPGPGVLEGAVIAGEWITLTAAVKNQGELRSGATRLGVFTDTLPADLDPFQARQADVGLLDPGQSTQVDVIGFRFNEPGAISLWAFADFFSWEEESDETNNVYTRTLDVLAPNLSHHGADAGTGSRDPCRAILHRHGPRAEHRGHTVRGRLHGRLPRHRTVVRQRPRVCRQRSDPCAGGRPDERAVGRARPAVHDRR